MPDVLPLYQRLVKIHFNIESDIAKENFLKHLGGGLKNHLVQLSSFTNKNLTEDELERLTNEFASEFHEKIVTARLFPEVKEVLNKLHKNGYDLAVSSGMLQDKLNIVVKMKEVYKYFRFVLGTKNSFSKGFAHFNFISNKLKLKPEKMVFVGDGDYDMKVGRQYGCFTVGRVDQISAETLIIAGADTVICGLKELFPLLKRFD